MAWPWTFWFIESFNFMLTCFDSGVLWQTHVLSPATVGSRKSLVWMPYCYRNDRAYAILFAMWSLERAYGTHHTPTLWNPNCIVILGTVPCDRLKSCISLFMATYLFFNTACSMHDLFAAVLDVMGLPLYASHFLSLRLKFWIHFCHTLTHHAVYIDLN